MKYLDKQFLVNRTNQVEILKLKIQRYFHSSLEKLFETRFVALVTFIALHVTDNVSVSRY
jgi:hypothetical protein